MANISCGVLNDPSNHKRLIRQGYVTQQMRRNVEQIRSRIRRGVPVSQQQRDYVAEVEALITKGAK